MSLIKIDTEKFERDYFRMMKAHGGWSENSCKGVQCKDCPLKGLDCSHPKSAGRVFKIVTEWAAANPEPPPEIDWERVPMDTPVQCSTKHEPNKWVDGFYCAHLPSSEFKFLLFADHNFRHCHRSDAVGAISMTNCRLSKQEDIEKYRKKDGQNENGND